MSVSPPAALPLPRGSSWPPYPQSALVPRCRRGRDEPAGSHAHPRGLRVDLCGRSSQKHAADMVINQKLSPACLCVLYKDRLLKAVTTQGRSMSSVIRCKYVVDLNCRMLGFRKAWDFRVAIVLSDERVGACSDFLRAERIFQLNRSCQLLPGQQL